MLFDILKSYVFFFFGKVRKFLIVPALFAVLGFLVSIFNLKILSNFLISVQNEGVGVYYCKFGCRYYIVKLADSFTALFTDPAA